MTIHQQMTISLMREVIEEYTRCSMSTEAQKGDHLTGDSCVTHTHTPVKKSTNYLETITMICRTIFATGISCGIHKPIPEERDSCCKYTTLAPQRLESPLLPINSFRDVERKYHVQTTEEIIQFSCMLLRERERETS